MADQQEFQNPNNNNNNTNFVVQQDASSSGSSDNNNNNPPAGDMEWKGGSSGSSVWSSQLMFHVYVLCFASVMVFAEGASLVESNYGLGTDRAGYASYAVALGVIALAAALTIGALLYFDLASSGQSLKIVASFLFVWNALGCVITTFGFPFDNVGGTPNGYFGVWVGAIIAAILLVQAWNPQMSSERRLQYSHALVAAWNRLAKLQLWVLLLIASLVVMVAASIHCGNVNNCTGINGFGVAFGVLDIVFTALFYFADAYMSLSKAIIFYAVLIFAFWWVAGFLALTFTRGSEFSSLGNGYFAVVVGTYCAVNLAAVSRREMNVSGDANASKGGGAPEAEGDAVTV